MAKIKKITRPTPPPPKPDPEWTVPPITIIVDNPGGGKWRGLPGGGWGYVHDPWGD
jgi:hypothetical protein